MIQLHKLTQLTQKAAAQESVYIVRELRKSATFPLTVPGFEAAFAEFFVSPTDITIISAGIPLVQPALDGLKGLHKEGEKIFEPLNIQRSLTMLSEIPSPLMKNLMYAQEIMGWQGSFPGELVPLLNRLRIASAQEKQQINASLSALFEKILRNSTFSYNASDIINEAHRERMESLTKGMENGFLFFVSLEDHVKRIPWSTLRSKIPLPYLQEVDKIAFSLRDVQKSVERAYTINMRMVNWALLLYSYIRWAQS